MRRIVTSLLLVFLALSWGLFILQARLQKDSDRRVAKLVWEEINYRREIEDSIKQGIEEQKKSHAFVMQLDYERQITDLISREISKLEDKQLSLQEELWAAISKEALNYRQAQKDYELKLSEYKRQLDGQGLLLSDSMLQLKDYGVRLSEDSETIQDLEKKIDAQGTLIMKQGAQLEEIEKELKSVLDKMEEIKTGLEY
jgi:membrane-associated HD superfamily phosphohydrolase